MVLHFIGGPHFYNPPGTGDPRDACPRSYGSLAGQKFRRFVRGGRGKKIAPARGAGHKGFENRLRNGNKKP
jgi:hypothetical protein